MPFNQIQSLKSLLRLGVPRSCSPENRLAPRMHCQTFPKRYPGINYISEQEIGR